MRSVRRSASAACRTSAPIIVDISTFDRPLFYAALPGSTADNAEWARRKRNVVQRFLKSTYRMVLEQQRPDRTFKPGSGIDSADYVLAGGGFPVTVRGAGVIGVIAVSGLPERDDHGIIVANCASISDWTRRALALGPVDSELRASARRRARSLDPKAFLTSIFEAAVAAADPELTIRKHLPEQAEGPHRRHRRRQRLRADGCGAGEAPGTGRSRAWSSPATAMPRRAGASASSKPRIRCPTKPGSPRRGLCSIR